MSKSFFYSNATAKKDHDSSYCTAYTGGIVGKNIGVLRNSVSYSNHIAGYTYSVDKSGDAPGAYTRCGAMMGWLTKSGTAENCYEQQNTFDAVAEFLKLEGLMKYVNEFHIYMDSFYRELDTVLKAAGVVLNGLLSSVF